MSRVKLNFSFNERYNSTHETDRSILRELAQATMAHPLRTPVKDVFPFATWLGSISTFRVRVGSFNYRCTRASVRRKVGGWQSTINWTDCRSPVQLALRNPFELTRLRLQIMLLVNVLVFSSCSNKRGYPNSRTINDINSKLNNQ